MGVEWGLLTCLDHVFFRRDRGSLFVRACVRVNVGLRRLPRVALRVALLYLGVGVRCDRNYHGRLQSVDGYFSGVYRDPHHVSAVAVVRLRFDRGPYVFTSLVEFPASPFLRLTLRDLFFLCRFRLFCHLVRTCAVLPVIETLYVLKDVFGTSVVAFFRYVFPSDLLSNASVGRDNVVHVGPFICPG